MKQAYIILAYQTLDSLSENDKIPYSTLWDLFQLKRQLHPHVDFFNERLEVIKKKYIPYADEKGEISGKHLEDYSKDIEELGNTEVDADKITKPTIKLKDLPGITLKFMEATSNFINYEKE